MRVITDSSPASQARQNRLWLGRWGRAVRLWIWASACAGLTGALATIVQLALMAWVVQAIVVTGTDTGVSLALTALAVAILVRALCHAIKGVTGAEAAREVRHRVRAELMAQWARQGPVQLAGESSGALANEWVEQVDALEGYFSRFLPQLWLALLVPLLVLLVVFVLDWLAALFLLLAAPLIPLFMVLVGMGAERLNQQHFASASRLASHFLDQVRGLTTLQLFGRAQAATESVGKAANEYRRLNLRTLRVAFLSSAVLEFFASVSIAVVAIYVGFGLLGYIEFGPAGELTLFSGLFVLLLAPEFFQPLRTLSQHYHDRAAALGAADHLVKRLAPTERPKDPCEPAGLRRSAPPDNEIVVTDLSVAYPGRGTVLNGLDFRLREGESLVLRGQSGSGKSSVLNILAGFYPATDGRVWIFGQAPGVEPVAWMNQRPFLIQGTWADNLRLTAPQASVSQMERAVQRAGLGEVLARQPQGLDTFLGEGGWGLSGGQAHRLALARVFLRPVRLLLLDEPTAGLDPYTQQEVIAALRTLADTGITLIMASHQPELMAMADHQLKLTANSMAGRGSRAND